MKSKIRFRLDIWKIIIIIALAVIIAGFSIIYGAVSLKLKTEAVFNQITDYVGNSDITMYGEYKGQAVEIARDNRDPIWKLVTDKNIVFTKADKIPKADPIIINLGNKLELDIYPMERFNVLVKHISGKKVYYYIINGTCNFNYLERMVSLEGWYVPNIELSNVDQN